jgi:site-specific recombinase XerD
MRTKSGSNRVKPPRRVTNASVRSREYLTEPEVERLRSAALHEGRYGHRDSTMIFLAYRHGYRAEELVSLKWDQVDLEQKILHVRRVKHGMPSVHPLTRPELAALRKLGPGHGPVFVTERGTACTTRWFGELVARAGRRADLGFPVHPHMLRHGCGYKLANDGIDTRTIQAWLGHRNIQHTVRYTELASDRFKGLWAE